MDPVVQLERVSKQYQLDKVRVDALVDANVSIGRGDFLSILGASGSGKSTLLHLIGCLDSPTSGKVYLNGVDIATLSSQELARMRGRSIGFVFQFFNLYPTLTAQENVELPMVIVETEKGERRRRAKELLRKVGLGDRTEHYPSQLSGGQRQRVAIARALANEPSMLLADEPTGNLDSKSGQEVMELFSELNKGGMTVVVVTHDANIARHTKHTIHVKDGRVSRGVKS